MFRAFVRIKRHTVAWTVQLPFACWSELFRTIKMMKFAVFFVGKSRILSLIQKFSPKWNPMFLLAVILATAMTIKAECPPVCPLVYAPVCATNAEGKDQMFTNIWCYRNYACEKGLGEHSTQFMIFKSTLEHLIFIPINIDEKKFRQGGCD